MNPNQHHVVIIGAGQAGIQVADSLRREGYTGAVTLIGDEAPAPYQRPQLSKDLLKPGEPSVLPLRAEKFFADNDITLSLGRRVEEVDAAAHTVRLDSGEVIAYSHLVFATGGRPRHFDVPGGDLPVVHRVQTLDQALNLRGKFTEGNRIVIVGAGFIGLEVAATARAAGVEVTLLPGRRSLMARSVSPVLSQWFEDFHRDSGIDVRHGESAVRIDTDATGATLVRSDEAAYPADAVVVGIGSVPNTELAAAAGLHIDDGVCVDAGLRTSAPDVWALGDCARFPGGPGEGTVRIESVQNATDQGKTVARNIVAAINGTDAEDYRAVPWFWSNQGTVRLQIAGLKPRTAGEVVTQGDPATGKLTVLCFDSESNLVAVETLNSPAIHMAARKVLAAGTRVTLAEAREPGFCLKALSRTLTDSRPSARAAAA